MDYVIGSGWYCKSKDQYASRFYKDLHNVYDMSEKWYDNVRSLTHPKKIVVVDSCSPVKPKFFGAKDIEYITMYENLHVPCKTSRGLGSRGLVAINGAFRQTMIGAFYALLCDAEFFVWIEQDVLLRGDGIVEEAISNMGNSDFSSGITTYMPDGLPRVESAFMIFRCSSLVRMCHHFIEDIVPESEDAIECKFAYLTSKFLWRKFPFDGGKDRPLDLSADYVFVHKPNDDEIRAILS